LNFLNQPVDDGLVKSSKMTWVTKLELGASPTMGMETRGAVLEISNASVDTNVAPLYPPPACIRDGEPHRALTRGYYMEVWSRRRSLKMTKLSS
jgi:hypothetical protein